MGRPSLELGTAGSVRTYPTAKGYRATTNYRDFDGKVRLMERHGATKGAATRALAAAVRDRAHVTVGAAVTPDTAVSTLAELWFSEIRSRQLSPSTLTLYRDRLDRQVLPALGQVRIRELSVGLIDRHLTMVRLKHGASIAKATRSVLSGLCGLACRHDALQTNPCRDVARISTKPRKPPESLSIEELRSLRQWLEDDELAEEYDIADLVSLLTATGLRIGEALALHWQDVDLDAHTLAVHGTVLRARGEGLMIKSTTKSAAGQRILELPTWADAMLRRRRAAASGELIFPSPITGGLRDRSNVGRALRHTFARAGYPGLTSHVFRKSVATLMSDAGLSSRAAADQLGHAKISLTQDVYFGRKKRATGAASVLEVLSLDAD